MVKVCGEFKMETMAEAKISSNYSSVQANFATSAVHVPLSSTTNVPTYNGQDRSAQPRVNTVILQKHCVFHLGATWKHLLCITGNHAEVAIFD